MDSLNRQIVGCLMKDGRASFSAIGTAVGLSAPAVKRRVDQMVLRREIAGFTAVISPAALGWETEAFVEIYYKGNARAEKLKQDLAAIPEVVSVWSVSGDADALVHVMASNMAEIEDTVERMRANRDVDRTRSVIVMAQLLDRPRAS